jgi:pimeloyl-ACP methyl ester carboxylesterase/DNA-binding CsgD family transcriptional regulator
MAARQEIRFCKSADGVDLAMALYGAGPPLVKTATWLTHVELDQTSPFDRALINELAPRWQLVTYDMRGCGLSQRRVDEVSLEAWVRDLEAVVDTLGLSTFPLLGISQGAAIAVAYAARHPDRVSQLILMGGFATSYFSSKGANAKTLEEAETLLKLVELGWGSPHAAFRNVFVSKFLPDATDELRQSFDRLQNNTTSPEMAMRSLRAMYSINVREAATQVRCPTLVLHVKGDQMASFDQGRRLASLIPGARFVPLEGNNHIPFENEPAWAELVQQLRRFLGGGEARPAAPAGALTPRQREVLRRVAFGQTDKLIARELQLSPRTVEMHVASAMKALGSKTRSEAVRTATEHGLLGS